METKISTEKTFSHRITLSKSTFASVEAKVRDGELTAFICYLTDKGRLDGVPLITFLMQNWAEMNELWRAVTIEILPKEGKLKKEGKSLGN